MRSDGLNVMRTSETEPRAIAVRRLTYSDLPAVMPIERQSFPVPWSLAMFLSELSRPQSICLAAVEGEELGGYLICSQLDREWHLSNIAVDPSRRRRGIASALIKEMLAVVGEDQAFTLEVRPSNTSAIALYEGLGFRSEGRRPGYYPDNKEDAIIMWRHPQPDRDPEPTPAAG